MSRSLIVVRALPQLRRSLLDLRREEASVALVPTMGALHEGHLALVRLAKRRADRVVVSLFVNPAQFAAHEDFGAYPRTLKSDIAKLAAEGVDLVWNPNADTMYPKGFSTRVAPEGPALAGLEDAVRPHFFGGVATVVTKLFTQVRPDFAIFGQKDYQQLQVVTQLSRDLDLGVKVVGLPTVRERDGLAMSSRNVYLTPEQRQAAPVLFATMKDVKARLRRSEDLRKAMRDGARRIEADGFKIDYFEARHAHTLAKVKSLADGPVRLLVAAKIGNTRLIDNAAV